MGPSPPGGATVRRVTDRYLVLLAIAMVTGFLAVLLAWAYQRRTLGAAPDREFADRVLANPRSVVSEGLGGGVRRYRYLLRSNPDPRLNRLRLAALSLDLVSKVTFAIWLLRPF